VQEHPNALGDSCLEMVRNSPIRRVIDPSHAEQRWTPRPLDTQPPYKEQRVSRPAKHPRTSRPPHGRTPEAGRASSVDDACEGPLLALPSTLEGVAWL
jgi:hypothetical protein